MRYEELKEEIKAIAEIANSVPEAFRERCFEILLQNLLSETPKHKKTEEGKREEPSNQPNEGQKPPGGGKSSNGLPTPTAIRVFIQKTQTTSEELARVVMFEDNQVHFIREPQGHGIAKGQIEWALLLALKNGFESGSLEIDPESVRSVCQEKGYYDSPNFQKNFKNNAVLFAGPMERQGAAQKLTSEGQAELAKVVKELAAKSGE